MSYPDIPRYATSFACSFSLRVYRFENAARQKRHSAAWEKRNPNKIAAKWARYNARNPRSFVSIEAALGAVELALALAVEQKNPRELLIEKEEAEICAC